MTKKLSAANPLASTLNSHKTDRKIYLFIFAFCFLLYGNTIKNNFSLDDEYVSRNHEQIKKGFGGIPEIFTTYYTSGSNTTHLYGYRPITKLTYAIEYAFFGENPHVSHFFNIIIYAFIGILLFALLKKWLQNYNIVLPLLTTFLFLSHPIHTEVVASIKNRDVLLSFLGTLLMFVYVLKYLETNRIFDLLWAICYAVLAYLSKPETQPSIFIIPVIVYFFTNLSVKKSIWVALLILGIGLLIYFITVWNLPSVNRPASNMEYHDNPLFFIRDWKFVLGLAFNSLFMYLCMLTIHYPLLYFYGYNTIPLESIFSFMPMLSLLIYVGMAVFSFFNFKNKNVASFGIIWLLLYVSIIANILTPAAGIVAERFIFAGSLGFCILFAYVLLKVSKVNFRSTSKRVSGNSTLVIFSGIVFLWFTGQVISRNNDWKDQLTLFRHDIKHLDNSVKAHEMLGAALMKESGFALTDPSQAGVVAEAIEHYKRTIEIYPDFAMGHNNLGTFYANLYNDCDKAIPHFIKALQVDTAYGEAMINLGLCYTRQSKTDDAIKMLSNGVRIEKGKFLISYTTLMALYFEKNDLQNAKKIFDEATSYFPTSEVPYREFGNQYIQKRDTTEAVKYFTASLKFKEDPQLRNFIFGYYKAKKDTLRANEFK